MKTYRAAVAREGKWWMVRVPEIDGLTQARRFSEVEEMARSLLAIALDVPEDSFDLRVELEAVEDVRVTERLDALHEAEKKAQESQAELREASHSLAVDLAYRGVPVRDIGAILGVSFQRAHQLVHSQ
ncbi:MAG TPA: hypothetical protein VF612_10765 [Jatrophihabitans sp.]|jgi:hypothetical protein|uniref:HicB family toxin-antitoxin system n=1 Tax=Jatrophihabitans sp. TaxID=1932789 RepID=UPI002EF6CFBA